MQQFWTKLLDIEDRARHLNLHLVGLPESAEGSNAITFLQENLPKWIPSLQGDKIEIQRLYNTTTPGKTTPRTLIFCLFCYEDRQKILKGSRALESPPKHGVGTRRRRGRKLLQRSDRRWLPVDFDPSSSIPPY
ncbi:hypothetical protein AAFF_G00176760 [Aldrovandia affinis]|uniref:Uncharacterized protein n=1 Tax=Aldrovandia affinis TaxID=143900 RepID=A0AAD7W6Y8_9TELE|nr:hypothetical protein AAFF_G00176760 [Aldrovandia affinis]